MKNITKKFTTEAQRPREKQAVILGVLDSGVAGLSSDALTILQQADVVIGARRTLRLFAKTFDPNAQIHDLTGNLKQVPNWITAGIDRQQSVVVLATGDPLCHGIGNYLIGKLGTEALLIMPNLSALQLACARAGISWEDGYICSVHSKDAGEWSQNPGKAHGLYPLFKACTQHRKIVVFTSPDNNPARIARLLCHEGLDNDFEMMVAERLLQPDARMVRGVPIGELATQAFADPNMVILQRKNSPEQPVIFGLEDQYFNQRRPDKGLITKREVRAVSLSQMQLKKNSIVWDIGAGSGAVGLEAARLCPNGWVYAIEKNAADFTIAESNRQQMGIHHYTLIHNKAPHEIDAWPDPDAVFVGGSGGELATLIGLILSRLKDGGHLVMNFVTLENLSAAVETLKRLNAAWDVTQMQVSRSKPILHMHRMGAENPVWIVTATPLTPSASASAPLGKLIAASLGPGDPGLITRKAWEAINSTACWCYPVRKRGGSSHALGIATRSGLATPYDAIPLIFPMTHDAELLAKSWAIAAATILPLLQAGRDVVFLVEGDASTFSTFTYLARSVQGLNCAITVEIIAGVPSFNAAAADSGMPLAETDDTVAIVPAGYGLHELDTLLPHFDTLVLLKVKPLLDSLIDWLSARDLLTDTLFVEKAGSPEERVVREVASLKGQKVNYLSLMLVRNPNRKRGDLIRGCKKKGNYSASIENIP
ncbi:MAG: precorrin-2 C(20)-methyltransferase [Mariprofundales bacterium]|nr:precorrin-2 C(20)-methyltransferase [Mariprofundales bacterium]